MYLKRVLSLGILLMIIVGICNQDKAVSLDKTTKQTIQSMSQGRPVEEDSTSTSDESELTPMVASQTKFGLKLFQTIIEQEPSANTLISPLSVGVALSMLYNGAEGVTQKELANLLEVMDSSIEEVNQSNKSLMETLENSDSEVVAIANSIWTQSGFPIQSSFIQTNQNFYDAKIQELDFAQPQAIDTINSWVATNTQNKITQIIDNISPNQALFLINAVYFKGQWQNKFDPEQTTEQEFYLSNGSTIEHPMMSNFASYQYYENPTLQVINLPYGSGNLGMNVYLPKENSNLNQFFSQLTQENLNSWQQQMRFKEGNFKMPRFDQEYEADLNSVLQQLGASSMFNSSQANFAALSEESVAVDTVKHKAVIEVNEEGTEAAATTSIGIRTTSVETPFNMIVNRPFFYTIQDRETGAILFMGTVQNPQS